MQVQIEHEPEHQRFVAVTDGKESYLRYAAAGPGTVDLRSTFVHRELRGRGVGEKLVREALEWARAEDKKVIPTCWFVETVLERHPEYRPLVASGGSAESEG